MLAELRLICWAFFANFHRTGGDAVHILRIDSELALASRVFSAMAATGADGFHILF